MHKIVLIAAIAALSACQQKAAEPANDVNVAAANDAAPGAIPAAFTINETSWEFIDPKAKKAVTESIDASGNYVTWAGAEHIDHGTALDKDGKACFTSAMDKEGEMCWTNPKIEPGASGETVNDKGEKLAIKRVAYVAKTM
ncbi:MAG: hypothetical protein ABIU10_08115 [Sphingomicrobium sp.]